MPLYSKDWTAAGIAMARALHRAHDEPVVFDDAVALHLLSPLEQRLFGSRWLYALLLRRFLARYRPYIFHSFVCQRYMEAELERAVRGGVAQYVVLGAGLDSYALRHAGSDFAAGLRVYEVDHPDSQRSKRARIARSPYALPDSLEFVPVDFDIESVMDGLHRSSFDFDRPAFCSWMGTVMYLTEEGMGQTLQALASLAPGSELIFNYNAPAATEVAHDSTSTRLQNALGKRETALQVEYAPALLEDMVTRRGYDIRAHLGGAELDARYLDGWGQVRTIPYGRLLHLGIQ